MRRVDIIVALGLIVFVAVMTFIVIPREASDGAWHGLSPYFYPSVMLAGVALSCVGLLSQALTSPKSYEDQPKTPITWEEFGFFLLICAIIFGGVMVVHWFGTWAGGFVLIAGTMIFMGCLNPLRIVAVALPTLAVNYVLVTWVLKIPLP